MKRIQTTPQTRAEATNYSETSSYDDVRRFLDALVALTPTLTVTMIGKSVRGREIPLAVLGKHSPKKRVVYIQANIHGGEVEGKEAALMLLRDLAQNDPKKLLEKLTLVVAPIYNIDGNEAWGDGRRNRGSQDGPEKIGERANGAGLDLNRDCIKAESPEMRAVLESVYSAWNPDIVIDLHTTNGTRHGYQLTYSPPLSPNTPSSVLTYTRDQLLPEIRKRLAAEKKLLLFDYGNAEPRGSETVWATFGDEPRYVTNYAGIRGKISILSEAASFLPFQTRVQSTYDFVLAILETLARDSGKIAKLVKEATQARPKSLGVRFALAARGVETLPLEKPGPVADHRKAPTSLEDVRMPIYDRFEAVKSASVPKAYLIPKSETAIIALLKRHEIAFETLSQPWRGRVTTFHISEAAESRVAFQGHKLLRLEGSFQEGEFEAPRGTVRVPTAQPLLPLIFTLLEPESLDGACAWRFHQATLSAGSEHFIRKVI